MFADLGQSHAYRRTRAADDASKEPSLPVTVAFPSLAESQAIQWSSLQSTRRRAPSLPKVFVKHQRTWLAPGACGWQCDSQADASPSL